MLMPHVIEKKQKMFKTNDNEGVPSKPLPKRSTHIDSQCERKSSGECSYRNYLDIIDLTGDGNEHVADSDSDMDYMLLPQICA
ncbi:uncharacterized protein LOC135342342 isoform X3 [Halichondria panicea]|uniref:uncharacterized protein LOC135342342 isoform X3 n=1 Tax=Halichondria panicea TaxID=6063 RepID=UPI00312B51E4